MVYPAGGRGNVYVGGAFAHSRRATLNVTNAIWNTEVMAAQNGTELVTDVSKIAITEYETKEVAAAATTVTLKYAPLGATGSKIGTIYMLNDDGTFGTKFTEDTTASSGKFSVSGTTVTFATGAFTAAARIALVYERQAADSAQLISVKADAIPDTALATCYGLAKDVCTGELYPCQVDGMVQIDGNYTFDLSADGDPAVHGLNMEFVRGCGTKKLYDFKVYEDEDPTE